MTATTIDPARLSRAVHLDAERTASSWIVGDWTVDPEHGCDCPDHRIRGSICKHELRVRLERLGDPVLEALRELVPMDVPALERRVA